MCLIIMKYIVRKSNFLLLTSKTSHFEVKHILQTNSVPEAMYSPSFQSLKVWICFDLIGQRKIVMAY